jgi:hypothetical protein
MHNLQICLWSIFLYKGSLNMAIRSKVRYEFYVASIFSYFAQNCLNKWWIVLLTIHYDTSFQDSTFKETNAAQIQRVRTLAMLVLLTTGNLKVQRWGRCMFISSFAKIRKVVQKLMMRTNTRIRRYRKHIFFFFSGVVPGTAATSGLLYSPK